MPLVRCSTSRSAISLTDFDSIRTPAENARSDSIAPNLGFAPCTA